MLPLEVEKINEKKTKISNFYVEMKYYFLHLAQKCERILTPVGVNVLHYGRFFFENYKQNHVIYL